MPLDVRAHELVAGMIKSLGLTGPTPLARKAGLSFSGPDNIRRWLKGDHDPDFESTMALLSAAGWLKEEEIQAAVAAVRAEAAAAAATKLRASARRASTRQRSRRDTESG